METIEEVIKDFKNSDSESNLMKFSTKYKPFQYPWAVELSQRHEQSHWIEDEAELGDDVAQWKSNALSDLEREYIINILRLFTTSDIAVGRNYYDQFLPKFKNNEVRNMLGSFAAREAIHQRAYALLNDTLGFPEEEFHAFLEYSEMAEKIEYMMDSDVSSHTGLAHALAKSVFNEGLCLFASFIMLLNFQRFGKMRGMCKIAEWSLADEAIHVEGISKLFKTFCSEHPRIVNDEFKKRIYDMAREIVSLEDKFIELVYKMGEPNGLGQDEVKQYIRYIADRRLLQLGLKPNFGVKDNPIDWLDWITGDRHANFFESRVADYDVAGLTGDWGW
jgi:glutaredoxin 3